MAALVLSSKIRLMFLDDRDESYKTQFRTESDSGFGVMLNQFMMDVERLRQEASEHGLSNLQEVKRFFEGKHDAIVDDFFGKWSEGKEKLYKAIKQYISHPDIDQRRKVEEAYKEFDKLVLPANTKFIEMTVDRYGELLSEN
jgi:hypothetical protein